MFSKPKNILSEKEHGFTLVELIVVIIIVGILAALGISQYSTVVEKSRLAEAKTRIGVMHKLAEEYWLSNGSLTGMTDADAGVDNTCTSDSFYKYYTYITAGTWFNAFAQRCTSGGKTPNVATWYVYQFQCYMVEGWCRQYCRNSDGSSCFGLPAS